ncbi:MAG: hypothetical protein IKH26_13200 [Bacteroidaceae bacterium]|nr:hypothetical protein [Bacteroidaceae bacterium]
MWMIRNKILPGRRFAAINLFGILFVKRGVAITPVLVNHEKIHTAQMLELLVVFFYLWYVVEWLVRYLKVRDGMKAYYLIGFEREAYANERNMNYLKTRRLFSFWKWMK